MKSVVCLGGAVLSALIALPAMALPLSPGDRLRVLIPEGQEFSGAYEVNLDGTLNIPYLEPLPVVGLEPEQVQQTITEALLKNRLFQRRFLRVSVTMLQWSSVQVTVSGAVFEPGRVSINSRTPEDRAQQLNQTSGDYPADRFLTAAIRSAGGVQPDANVKQVQLTRNGQTQTIDLSGVFAGEPIADVPLVAGDQVVVPRDQQMHYDHVRPSQITPPGIQIFLSNLTVPASSNATSGINSDTSKIPYGIRLSQAVMAANCVGGTRSTNARRRVLLVRTDRYTGQTHPFERSVEDLMRHSNSVDTNPFLMPGDGIACYDSTATNLQGVAQLLGAVFSPFKFILDLFR